MAVQAGDRRGAPAQDWRESLRAGMAELLEVCARQPPLARALFVEVHAAGGGRWRAATS